MNSMQTKRLIIWGQNILLKEEAAKCRKVYVALGKDFNEYPNIQVDVSEKKQKIINKKNDKVVSHLKIFSVSS